MTMQQIHIIGGGTVFHVRPHFAIAAPAYGRVVRDLFSQITHVPYFDGIVHLYTTKMAGNRYQVWTARSGLADSPPKNLETNADVADLLNELMIDPQPKVIFLPAAMCDFDVEHVLEPINSENCVDARVGKDLPRLQSSGAPYVLRLTAAEKVISRIRKSRKDIFLVGFKTTTGANKQEQFEAGLTLVKKASCNLVLANDLETRVNMVVTPEQAPHYVTTNRVQALGGLVKMAIARSQGHFTRSEVVEGPFVGWTGEGVPAALRTVVDHCIKRGAYRPFMGKTVGHFAFKVPTGPGAAPQFITSRRGVNFNELEKVGMVAVMAEGDDKVVAIGGKPSVGGQSQRIIFAEHPDLDCIVHFHCPLRPEAQRTRVQEKFDIGAERIEVRSQEAHECGSHECGKNTSDGLKMFLVDGQGTPLMKAVMLDKHGPNIVFNSKVNPAAVIDFIERHWDLERQTSEVLNG